MTDMQAIAAVIATFIALAIAVVAYMSAQRKGDR